MSRISKNIKPHVDILIEYVYDNENNISENYSIIHNTRDKILSYVSNDSSITNNSSKNQLFQIDSSINLFGRVDGDYSFIQKNNYSQNFPIPHDIVKIHLPINYMFNEYDGCYVKIYTLDSLNKNTVEISNYYFNKSDLSQADLVEFTSPPFQYQEKLWGKYLKIEIPSISAISSQVTGNKPTPNSINYNLTNGLGVSDTSPVFIDFYFIERITTINNVDSFYLTNKRTVSVPQKPDYENIGLKIEHSNNGDYFEIYGTFNSNIAEFKKFIDNSYNLGNRYYVQYSITTIEQNIRGKTLNIVVDKDFSDKIEFRPIIKYSSTTAVIDVEMNIVNYLDNSSIYRKATYGMLQDEVSKYSINLTKINLANANKPKIYNLNSADMFNSLNNNGINNNSTNISNSSNNRIQTVLQPIKVNYAVLADKFNLVAKSDSVVVGKDNYFGLGKLQILLQPFDNIIEFIIASDVIQDNSTSLQPRYLDMSSMGEIKLIFKNDTLYVENKLYLSSNKVDLTNGVIVFKIPSSKMPDIKKIYESGLNLFYITATSDSGTLSIYSGTYKVYDSLNSVQEINTMVNQIQTNIINNQTPSIISDPNSNTTGTAYVTRRIVTNTTPTNPVKDTVTSVKSTVVISNVNYQITDNSSLIIDGYEFTNNDIKKVLELTNNPLNLTINIDNLYSNNMILDKLPLLKTKLETTLDTNQKVELYNITQKNFNK